MIVIKLENLKSLGRNKVAVKVAAVSALAIAIVPISIFGFATNENDYVETASTIVEVDSITSEAASIEIEPTTNVVDEGIANVLGINSDNGVINDNIDGVKSIIDSTQKDISKKAVNYTAKAEEEKGKQIASDTDTKDETKESTNSETRTETNADENNDTTDYVESTPSEDVYEDVYVPEYVVFKPNTHYVHRNTCRWVDSSCYEITSTADIEARRCTECNADIEIVNEYIPETPVGNSSSIGAVDDYDRQLLAEIVWHEAGSSWISQYDKARIAAGVMNRVYDSRFPNTVYGVLTAPYQFSGFWPGYCTPTQACYDAVDYYFSHTNEFDNCNSWYGDGYQNHFYYQ